MEEKIKICCHYALMHSYAPGALPIWDFHIGFGCLAIPLPESGRKIEIRLDGRWEERRGNIIYISICTTEQFRENPGAL